MQVTKRSVLTGREHTREIEVEAEALEAWRSGRDGRLIQIAFPNLSADDREFLLTGSTPEEWESAFGEED